MSTVAGRAPTPALIRRATWAFMALGVAIRLVRYLLDYPLWGDEAFVAVDFIDRGYRGLLRPMTYHQICPLLFLWAERTAVKFLGFSEWSLRLVPALCAGAGVLLFRRLANLLVGGVPALLAVGIFAVSYYPIRHSAEVKPYASDLLAALVLLVPAAEWLRSPGRTRWAWALAAAAPPMLALSHTAAFVAGGVALALAPAAWKARGRGALVPFGAFLAGSAATFLGLYFLFTAHQAHDISGRGLEKYWAGAFPPRHSPIALLGWLLRIHTGHMFAYPAGGANGLSLVTTLCVLAGAATLARRRALAALALILAPFGLNLLAAAIGAYPYGDAPRIMQYAAPGTCLLAGLGIDRLFARARAPGRRLRLTSATLGALALLGLGLLTAQLVAPARSPCDQRSREFARWLWSEKGRHAEIACIKSDFGLVFNRRHWDYGRTALYLCNRRLYAARPEGAPPAWDKVADDRPLVCVFYNEMPEADPAFHAWLGRMTARYDLRSRATFDVNSESGRHGDLEDRYHLFEFVPRASGPPHGLAGAFGGDGPWIRR